MYEVVGFQSVNYTNKNGVQIDGIKIFCCYEDSKIEGMGCIDFYISRDKLSFNLALGDEIEVFYNRYGKVDRIIVEGE